MTDHRSSRPRTSRHVADVQGMAPGSRPADVDEQSRSRGRRAARTIWSSTAAPAAPRAAGTRSTRSSRELRRLADDETLRRAVGQAGRRLSHARQRTARDHRQRQPRPEMGDVGDVPRSRGPRPHDVRPDDGRQLDLHRHAGHSAGHLRDAGRARAPSLRRIARRTPHRHRRPRRHGRRAAARRHDERGRGAGRRSGSATASSGGWPRGYLDEATDDLDDGARKGSAVDPRRASPARSACRATRPTCCRSSCAAA